MPRSSCVRATSSVSVRRSSASRRFRRSPVTRRRRAARQPAKGYVGRISLLTGRDTSGNAFPIPEHGIHIGRERGDIVFPEDGYVSGLHCRVSWDNGGAFLTDLGSSNGTFIRIGNEHEVRSQDVLLMGQQLFRINLS